MADYLKSALSYFATSNTTKNENEFLGSSISVGQLSLKVKRIIAEGGYGIVYEAQDVNENTSYALKVSVCFYNHLFSVCSLTTNLQWI